MKLYSVLAGRMIEVPDRPEDKSANKGRLMDSIFAELNTLLNEQHEKNEQLSEQLVALSEKLTKAEAAAVEEKARADAAELRLEAANDATLAAVSATEAERARLTDAEARARNALDALADAGAKITVAEAGAKSAGEALEQERKAHAATQERLTRAPVVTAPKAVEPRKGYKLVFNGRDGNGDITGMRLIPE